MGLQLLTYCFTAATHRRFNLDVIKIKINTGNNFDPKKLCPLGVQLLVRQKTDPDAQVRVLASQHLRVSKQQGLAEPHRRRHPLPHHRRLSGHPHCGGSLGGGGGLLRAVPGHLRQGPSATTTTVRRRGRRETGRVADRKFSLLLGSYVRR